MTTQLRPGLLLVTSARPTRGKTALARPAALEVADAPTGRLNRIPRRPAPRVSQPSLAARAVRAAKGWYLAWMMRSLGAQLDRIEAHQHRAARRAQALALARLRSPRLEQRRKALRVQHGLVSHRIAVVRRRLDMLDAGTTAPATPPRGGAAATACTTLLAIAAAITLLACGGGGSSEEPEPRRPVHCAQAPEQCK